MSKSTTTKKAPKTTKTKPSGVEWLGDIPEHWEVRSLRGILLERGEINIGKKIDFILSVMKDRGVVPYTEKGNVGNKMSEDISDYKIVYPGDLVINKMNAIIGSLGISKHKGALSKVYFVLKPRYNYVNNNYIGYLFKIQDFQKSLCKISYGIMELRESINFNLFKNLKLPLPPKAEQDEIVAFLDRKTAQIDALIEKKQRLLKLLDEQLAIKINNAVTKGIVNAQYGTLNPHLSTKSTPIYTTHTSSLKKSGIEWIGEIPEEWKILKLRRLLTKIEQGNSPSAVQDDNDPLQWKVITLSAVSKGQYLPEKIKPIPPVKRKDLKLTLKDGDFLLTRANTRNLVGECAIVTNPLQNTTFSDLVYRFTINSTINKDLLLQSLLSNTSRAQIELDARGSNETMVKVSHGHIKEWDVVVPTVSQQRNIVEYLSAFKNNKLELEKYIKKQIHSLKTYRNHIISNAAIGKHSI